MATKSRFKILVLIGLCLSLTIAGCGRKGSLDDPGAPAPTADAAVDPANAAAEPQPVSPEAEKSFFLDFLIK